MQVLFIYILYTIVYFKIGCNSLPLLYFSKLNVFSLERLWAITALGLSPIEYSTLLKDSETRLVMMRSRFNCLAVVSQLMKSS